MLMKWLEGQFIDFDVAHVGHEYKWRNLGEELGRARVTKRAEDNREAERAGRMGRMTGMAGPTGKKLLGRMVRSQGKDHEELFKALREEDTVDISEVDQKLPGCKLSEEG